MLKELKPALDLTNFTHIRLMIKGSNPNSHDSVEVKLYDGKQLYAASLKSIADLPVWRPIYIDFREFVGGAGNKIDLTNISRLEIALVRCVACEVIGNPDLPPPSEQYYGTLYLNEFAAVDLKPGAANRLVASDFESVVPNPGVRDGAASALLSQVTPSGPGADLIPAWFPQANPNYNTYAESEAVLVSVAQTENPEAIHFMIQFWDGSSEQKKILEGAIYWDLNPWTADGSAGKIKVYVSGPNVPQQVAISLPPDTNWHRFELIVDLKKKQYLWLAIDGRWIDISHFQLHEVSQPNWGNDLSLAITTESLAAFPQPDCGNVFTWTTQFRNVGLDLVRD